MKFIRALLARPDGTGATARPHASPPDGADAPSPRDLTALVAGDVIAGRYRFVERIGRGAFGTLFLVEELPARERLLLKVLNPHLAADEETVERFARELRYVRRISHPNVIRLYDFLLLDGHCAISMEYFPSHTLAAEMAAGELAVAQALRYGRAIAAGMQAAHDQGIVHRDLKPSNILIDREGALKIVDFGVAAAAGGIDANRRAGYVVGSPRYMAPEQVVGQPADQRSDIYSLGCILYHMLAGAPPYPQDDPLSVMYQHVQGSAQPLRQLRPELPAAVAKTVHKAMAVESSARFGSMQELGGELARFAHLVQPGPRRLALPH